MNKSLDEMIKSYSEELMRFAKDNNPESLVAMSVPAIAEGQAEEKPGKEEKKETEETLSETENQTEKPDEVKVSAEIPAEEELENYATFKARVFTGLEAFPIEKAKVLVYKDDILYAFLVTDKNGETQQIKIEAFPEKNSLEPLSDKQRTDYTADVYAEGFNEKRNLLVSAVGGSDIVLDVELIPESEAIS